MNWEKMRSPAKATFKNPNFQFLLELEKLCKYSQRPTFQSPNFVSMAGHISNFSSSLKNLSLNVFHREKLVFKPTGNCVHTAKDFS